MTRASTEQLKHTQWFAKAGAACSIVPITLTGLDEEALTDFALEARVRQVEGALSGLSEGSCLYQAGIMAFHAFHTLSFAWPAFRPAMLDKPICRTQRNAPHPPRDAHLYSSLVKEIIGDWAKIEQHRSKHRLFPSSISALW